MTITFCIPAYNDEKTIATVVSRAILAGTTLKIPYKIYVLNDGSTDHTSDILNGIKNITTFTHVHNQGYGMTIKELYALVKTEWLFTVPGDYQVDPMEILKLWKEHNNADFILGYRYHRQDGLFRAIHSKIYHGILRLLFDIRIQDINSVRLVRKKLIRVNTSSAFVDAEMIINAQKKNARILEVPIEHMPRLSGTAGGASLASSFSVFIDILRTWKKLHFENSKNQI